MLQGHGNSSLLWVGKEGHGCCPRVLSQGVVPPCAAAAVVGRSQPLHPRQPFALENKDNPGYVVLLLALSLPAPLGCVSLLSPAPHGSVLSLVPASLRGQLRQRSCLYLSG